MALFRTGSPSQDNSGYYFGPSTTIPMKQGQRFVVASGMNGWVRANNINTGSDSVIEIDGGSGGNGNIYGHVIADGNVTFTSESGNAYVAFSSNSI